MAIVISGVNNNDKITAADGTIDLLSGVNYVGVLTAPHINVGNSIQLGNAGIITATTLVGNVQGNINHTSNLLLQISGSEKFRIGTSGQLGIGGANYGSAGQVLTSGGSGSAATWSTVSGTTINNNAANRIITGSGTANTLNGNTYATWNGNNFALRGGEGQNCTIELASDEGDDPADFWRMMAQASDNALAIDHYGTGSWVEKMRIDSSGNFKFTNYTTSGGPYLVFDNRGNNTTDNSNTYNIGGIAAAGYRDIANPSIVAAIQFERQPTASGASSGGNILFRTGFNGTTSHTGVSERMRLTYGGDLGINNSIPQKKVHISTTGNQKIVIDPNYANNSGGSSNSEANAGNIVESILIRTSYGDNAGSSTNAGHKWGIKFQGYNGNDFTQARSKCAGVFAVSEDSSAGYNRNVGLAFHTSQFDTAHREVMRINTNGIVTKPYQYVFMVATGGVSKAANWAKVTGLSPISAQCTGVSDGSYWSNSNQQFTAPVTGTYVFYVGGWATPNSNGTRYAYSFRHTNGNNLTYIGGGDYCSGDSPMAGWSRVIKLSAGEWVELWMYSAITATLGGGHYFYWGGYLLG